METILYMSQDEVETECMMLLCLTVLHSGFTKDSVIYWDCHFKMFKGTKVNAAAS